MARFWRNWLTIWCAAVILFGVTLLLGGIPATAAPVFALLDLLNGAAPLDITPALYFANGVLGGVTIGWGVGRWARCASRPIWAIRDGGSGAGRWRACSPGS
ncbi:MAG: hypothetical protein A4S12_01050 [Proteobacteria bacterium SG_bin5]|nr:hypothetical protein [Sphingomonas sp.]OQW42255.1 MAG: hypothetical protein A4S12_01050 [Proteobacteria bacterium SG_bin5]